MKQTNKVKTFLNLNNQKIEIGSLVANQSKIYFKYDEKFLDKGLEISPFKMKLSNEILTPKELYLEGLFGVFLDSIPDGWGRLLLDKKLISLGLNLNQISPLDRLTFIDNNAMGAISYEPEYENDYFFKNSLDLDKIALDVEAIIQGSEQEVIEEIYTLGGSSGGARPKILVGFNDVSGEIIYGSANLPDGFEHWIIKFPASNDLKDIALIEYSYNTMAKKAGIEVNEFRLFKSKNNNYFFGSKRFDRIKDEKLHLHSFAGLLHDNFRQSSLDYGHIMDCAFILEKDFNAYSKVLRLATFNVLAHNKDDHSKNFAFLMDKDGKWKFAPAYDLTFSNSSFGLHSTTVAGESKNPSLDHLQKLAIHFGLKNTNLIFDEVKEAISQFNALAKDLEINKSTVNMVKNNLKI